MCLEPTGRFGWRWKFRKVCGKEAVEVVGMGDTAQEREEEVWDPLRETPAVEDEPAEGTERNRWNGRREPQRVWCQRSSRGCLFSKGRA